MCCFRYVKVYDISDNYALVASISYPSPILAIDLSVGSLHKTLEYRLILGQYIRLYGLYAGIHGFLLSVRVKEEA